MDNDDGGVHPFNNALDIAEAEDGAEAPGSELDSGGMSTSYGKQNLPWSKIMALLPTGLEYQGLVNRSGHM